jgi:hypothetical protein
LESDAEAIRSSLSPGHCFASTFSVYVLRAKPWTTPATGQAVQGQTAAQPEGTVLNLVNWVGNVIAPVGAALAVVMAIVAYSQGRGAMRWAVTAGGLLVVSGLTRLTEF